MAAGLLAGVAPAQAGKPPAPTASVVMSQSGCDVTATYSWQNFRVKGKVGSFVQMSIQGGGSGQSFHSPVDPAGGSEVLNFPGVLTTGPKTITATGFLFRVKSGKPVRGSVDTDGATTFSC